MKDWLTRRGFEIGDYFAGNSVNMSDYVSAFEYVHFVDKKNNREGIAVMWHQGGDVRSANYSSPEIWIGEKGKVEEFLLNVTPSEATSEVATEFGYSEWVEFEKNLLDVVKEKVNKYKTASKVKRSFRPR